tara:strand:- start:258 stop:497 length:240 start_codon:yes stop_codon:yes gene_type:complete
MRATDIYIKENGTKSTKKLDKIILAISNNVRKNFKGYEVNGIPFSQFSDTKRMQDLRNRFEIEVERIGGVPFTFGDVCA